jgi:hypothetical protein
MKVKDLIEQLSKFPQDMEVIGTYPYWDTSCGRVQWELTDGIDLHTAEVLKEKNGFYSYEESYVLDKIVPYTKQTVLILDL